ncbi:hypothetical protein DL768_003766 [Monosporascus sp. mg162]|nr:hypothetical protein DL768_003766 [Monosporascus sp. mg162]
MSTTQSHVNCPSFPTPDAEGSQSAVEPGRPHQAVASADLNGFSLESQRDGLPRNQASDGLVETSQFPDFSFAFQDVTDGGQMIGLEGHTNEIFATPGHGSLISTNERKDSITSGPHSGSFSIDNYPHDRQLSLDGSDDGGLEISHAVGNALEDNMSDDFGLSASAPGDGTDLGGKLKDTKSDPAPAWSELKTKAGKERKRLPLACIACRRKKIRCSGEKPACKHCLRSRIPCVYKVTTRKAAPRTDYMAMLDKRLKKMEDRIIKAIPKSEMDASIANVTRAVVKPSLPGALLTGKQPNKKRNADEAFGADLDQWARATAKTKLEPSDKPGSIQVQEAEENKLLREGEESLPPKDLQEQLSNTFFECIYGQAYHVLHKPSYMRKLKAGTLPPVLVLSVCAISARFSTHPRFASTPNFLRGEEWAGPARQIVLKRQEWPNITILTCALVLALHDFGTCHGGRSWAFGGIAIRMAIALQLHKDLESDVRRHSDSQLSFIDREIRRRTMWACFLMDRFTSSGVDRPIFIKEEWLKIQLPIKEKLFQLDMPGPTEDLQGRVPHPVPDDEGQLSKAEDNMGVAAYMIRALALWGRVINYLNQGGKESDPHPMWDDESEYANLLGQAEGFASNLPDGLKYNAENLHLHHTEKMANQFLFLHIVIQQNILFMGRFAISSPTTGLSPADVPEEFVTKAGAKAFAAANRISELLRDSEPYMVAAPFVGYCAFLSATVHIFGIFSGNATVEMAAKKNLATNVKFLSKMKRYWGMFHFMSENLRQQYRSCADAARQGTPAESSSASPIFQYGDWFDRYPLGVSQSDFVDPAAPAKKKETGDDAVLEQKQELHTVEEFITQLSPPQSTEGREAAPSRAPLTKRKSIAKKGGGGAPQPSRSEQQQRLEPLLTDISGPEQIQQQIQQRANYARLGGQSGRLTAPHFRATAGYPALSPISPVHQSHQFAAAAAHGGHGHGQHRHHRHAGSSTPYNHSDLLSLSLSNPAAGMLPQLDRQLVFNAYGGLDPATPLGGSGAHEPLLDWDALGSPANGAGDRAGGAHHHHDEGLPGGFVAEPSSAWFMPFNMEPPELGQDLNGLSGLDPFGAMFSAGGVHTPGAGLGLRRGGR